MGRPPSNGGPAFRFTQNEVSFFFFLFFCNFCVTNLRLIILSTSMENQYMDVCGMYLCIDLTYYRIEARILGFGV